MAEESPRTDLLRDIETRQDQVLAELDALERQLEQLLAEYGIRPESSQIHHPPRQNQAA